ncbi:PREDICTED: UPF0258 protein KIAA1024 homolog [Myotis davidii]|uniref:UPF0258 protein KIAA1024 homolog n=1 Tax=Myotis davidii TaxID=225400 RepID=UPI0007672DB2|nr:PREDICTED: UPF0258 protein KIAA1024 homolog [Myotis davidii]
MEAGPDTSLFLVKVLEELDSKHSRVSYQDLCKSLCARFDLPQLARLRSLLFYTACLDPGFPATLFKDKMKCPGNNQQSKKIMVATPAAWLDRLQALPPYAAASPQPCEMQRTYFPMTLDSEPVSDQDSLPGPPDVKGTFVAHVDDDGPFGVRSCVQKRSIFKEDFHNLLPVSPGLVGPASQAEGEHGDPQSRKEPPKTPFFNHSFDMPYNGRYLNAGYSPVPDKRRSKHESLDDLQASTYFGPTPVMGTPEAKRCPGGRPGKQTPWPAKSWSLNTEEVPDFERSFFHGNGGSNSESLRVQALKKSLFARPSSRSLTEENSATESKIASISNSPRDWRTITYAHRLGLEEEEEEEVRDRGPGESKGWRRKPKEVMETPARVAGARLASAVRMALTWARGLAVSLMPPLPFQTQESLNPNHLEYWMEDIYTPGYDSLLKRKEAESRRARACKLAALVAAAACMVILVIVVPLCTMKS